MYSNYIFKNANEALVGMTGIVMALGGEVGSRAGRVKELTMVGLTITNPTERYLTNTHRKHSIAAQIAETMWVLSGRDDVAWLSHYLPRAKDFSDDGKVWAGAYGARLRAWPRRDGSDDVIDQLAWVIEHLQKDPLSRRAVMSIFDPVRDQGPGKDIPCNDFLDFKSRLGKLDLHVALRSNDLIWGWSGINQFEWSVLLEIVAALTNVQPGSLHFSIGSLHVYDRHWARAEDIRESEFLTSAASAPRFAPAEASVEYLDRLIRMWFDLEERIRQGEYSATLDTAIAMFPEPMMRSWLWVLRWWWSGEEKYLKPVRGTTLEMSARLSVQPKRGEKEVDRPTPDNTVNGTKKEASGAEPGTIVDINNKSFSEYVADLHAAKHAGYGDSWKKRGELMSILPNIARKVDRLQQPGDDVETKADTAIDLLVYLLKYRWWLVDQGRMGGPFATTPEERADEVTRVNMFLGHLDRYNGWVIGAPYEIRLAQRFDEMASRIEGSDRGYHHHAATMDRLIEDANALACREFWKAGNAKRSWKGYGDA